MAFAPTTLAPATEDYRKCPNGHGLPRQTFSGNCTPLHCADDVKALDVTPPASDEEGSNNQLLKATKDAIVEQAKKKLRRNSRERLVKVPEFKTATEAEDWANAEKARMLPYAIAEKEYRLLYGNDEQRDSASDYFLDALGHGKKESGMGTGATIIIMGDPSALRPWASKQVQGTTVDAIATEVTEATTETPMAKPTPPRVGALPLTVTDKPDSNA